MDPSGPSNPDNGAQGEQPPSEQPSAVPATTHGGPIAAVLAAPGNGATPPISAYSRSNRTQKTPQQKQALEEAFLAHQFLTDEMKRELSVKIGLTEHQISTWFTHRRRKFKEDAQKLTGGGSGGAHNNTPNAGDSSSPLGSNIQEYEEVDDLENQQKLEEYKELLKVAASQLPEHREDGPPLGFVFDDIPTKQQPQQPQYGNNKRRKNAVGDDDPDYELAAGELKRAKQSNHVPRIGVIGAADLANMTEEEKRSALLAEHMWREQQRLEAAMQREREKMARELQHKNAKLAKERERELARFEAFQRKELERMLREQRKEEERRYKEMARLQALQEKEERRLALQLERERKAEEKKREKEEKRLEREKLKALNQQERAAMRLRARENAGPKDDVDLEWEALCAKYRQETRLPPDVPLPKEGDPPPEGYPPLPQRPVFPPPTVTFVPPIQESISLSDHAVGDLFGTWSSLMLLRDMIGLDPITPEQLLMALNDGLRSSALADAHIGLLRLIQADAEDAHNTISPTDFRDGAAAASAKMIEEAFKWGFDVNVWRAHLNRLTWPEIARELAIAASLGRKRPQPRRETQKARMGVEGEDILVDTVDDFQLQLPARLPAGTIKGASWLVLAEIGPEGLHCEEIARRIQNKGFRDLRSSKTPETSVSGALAKDVLFERVAPATFALTSVRARARRLASNTTLEGGGGGENAKEGGGGGGDNTATTTTAAGEMQGGKGDGGGGGHNQHNEHHHQDDDYDEEISDAEEEERRRRDEAHEGEAWVAALATSDYNSLSMDLRVAMLSALCTLALESPTAKDTLEKRLDEQQRLKRQLFEESKVEAALQKQKRHAEAAAKAKQAAEEAEKALQLLNAQMSQQDGTGGNNSNNNGPTPMAIDQQQQPGPATAAIVAANTNTTTTTNPTNNPPNQLAEPSTAALTTETAEERAAAKKRQQERTESVLQEMAQSAVRVEPLGLDRKHNRYWRLAMPGCPENSPLVDNRIFFESIDDGKIHMLADSDSLKALMSVLIKRGPREGVLLASLTRFKDGIERAMPALPLGSSLMAIDGGDTNVTAVVHQLDEDIGQLEATKFSPSSGGKPTSTHHKGSGGDKKGSNSKSNKSLEKTNNDTDTASPELVKIRNDMVNIATVLSSHSILDISTQEFDLAFWSTCVNTATSLPVLISLQAELEDVIPNNRLHSFFIRQPYVLRGAWSPVDTSEDDQAVLGGGSSRSPGIDQQQQQHTTGAGNNHTTHSGDITNTIDTNTTPEHSLKWLPQTISALALRVQSLDAAVLYEGDRSKAGRDTLDGYRQIQLPRRIGKKSWQHIEGLPIDPNARITSVLFPPFPYRLLHAPRIDFTFPVTQFKSDVATGSDAGVIVASTKGPGRGRGRGRGGGGRGSGGGSGRGGGGGVTGGGGGHVGGPGRKRQRVGVTKPSALAKEFVSNAQKAESDKHYGSDYDHNDDDDDFMNIDSRPGYSGGGSGNPSEMFGGDNNNEGGTHMKQQQGEDDEEISVDSQGDGSDGGYDEINKDEDEDEDEDVSSED